MSMELLSPAADPEVFRAVIDAGADAVYFGGTAFGARAGAASFDPQDAYRSVCYAHMRGRKAYLTVNTLVKNVEMETRLYPFLKEYYEAGVDGVIVQDLGVISMIRSYFPDWRISASTQMTAASVQGARFLESLGVRRMVAPRELSFEEMKAITAQSGIELEVFVHGALCVCYSGQCLMSSMIGGRSGNRGRCAQTCRLPFSVREDQRPVSAKGPYVLSLKDLCGLADLPELEAAGVASLKIEGRLKGAAYAAGVTGCYRRVLDRMAEGQPIEETVRAEEQILFALGNRNGFTDRYYHAQNGRSMVSFTDSAHHHDAAKPPAAEPADDAASGDVRIPVYGSFAAAAGKPVTLEVRTEDGRTFSASGAIAEPAQKRPLTEEEIRRQLERTKDTPFAFAELSVVCDGDVFLPVSALNALRRDALSGLLEELVLPKRRAPLPYAPVPDAEDDTDADGDKRTLLVVSTAGQLSAVTENAPDSPADVAVSASLCASFSDAEWEAVRTAAQTHGLRLFLRFPPVIRARALRLLETLKERIFACDGVLCGSVDGLGWLQSVGYDMSRVTADTNLYTWSDRTLSFLRGFGLRRFCAPLELNAAELSHRSRAGAVCTVYGRPALMHMANCIREDTAGCDHRPHAYELTDRKNARFPVRNDCMLCMNTIFNSLPISLLGQLREDPFVSSAAHRLDFTTETAAQVRTVLACHAADRPLPDTAVTRGHYRRGVE